MELLQVEEQVAIVVQQFRVQLIDEMGRLLDPAVLHCVTDQNAILQGDQFDGRLHSRLLLELLGGLFESLCESETYR